MREQEEQKKERDRKTVRALEDISITPFKRWVSVWDRTRLSKEEIDRVVIRVFWTEVLDRGRERKGKEEMEDRLITPFSGEAWIRNAVNVPLGDIDDEDRSHALTTNIR